MFALRIAPLALGTALLCIGALLFVWPELLSFVVATFFVLAGLGVIGFGLRPASEIRFRRIDQVWQVGEDEPGRL